MKRRVSNCDQKGFTLIEVMIVVGIIGLLVAAAVPNAVRARKRASTQMCIGNQMQLESAKQRWAIDTGKDTVDTPALSDLVGTNLYLRMTPYCPAGGTYTLGSVGEKVACSLGAIEGHTLQ